MLLIDIRETPKYDEETPGILKKINLPPNLQFEHSLSWS